MEKPPSEPPQHQPPVERDDVRVATSRCPYCRDDVTPTASVVCESCLARHHEACWTEAGSCSSCQSTHRLERAQPQPKAWQPVVDPEWETPPLTACAYLGCERPNEWDFGAGKGFRWCKEHALLQHSKGLLGWLTLTAVAAIPAAGLALVGVWDSAPSSLLMAAALLAAPGYFLVGAMRRSPRRDPNAKEPTP